MAARGDVQEITLFTISVATPLATGPTFKEGLTGECCVDLFLFGDNSDPANTANPFRNDKTSYLEYYSNDTDTAVMKLQKCVNGLMTDQHTVTDDTYGTFSDFGDFEADNRKYISLKSIDWTAILLAFGEGKYRLIVETTNILASVVTVPRCTFTYTLKNYSDERADGTVFIKSENIGIIGNIERPTEVFTFPPEWSDGIRIPAWFGGDTSEYEEETVLYASGFEKDLTNDQVPKYVLDTDALPSEIHNFIKTYIWQANAIKITDYNTDNSNRHTETQVKRTSEHAPNWIKRVKKATVSVEFKSAFNNLRALPCK